jgi:hypothetical protein
MYTCFWIWKARPVYMHLNRESTTCIHASEYGMSLSIFVKHLGTDPNKQQFARNIMNRKFKQWWSTILSIWTKRKKLPLTSISWTLKNTMTLCIQVLAWDRQKKQKLAHLNLLKVFLLAHLNQLKVFQLWSSWLSDFKRQCVYKQMIKFGSTQCFSKIEQHTSIDNL